MPSPSVSLELEDQVKQHVFSGKCVAFLGAGVSIPPGKNWQATVREIALRCGVSVDHERELPEIIDKCLKKDEDACNQACRTLFPKHVAESRTAMDYLLRLPFKAILTVNFDPWLHQHSRRENYKRCHVYPDLPLKDGLQGGIYYVHGYFDSEDKDATIRSLVFGKESFGRAYSRSLLPGFLLHVFTYETVLFVGMDPTEENISELIYKSIGIRNDVRASQQSQVETPMRFVLWPDPSDLAGEERNIEENKISEIKSLDIELHPYKRKADDYRGLEKLLYSWVQEGDIRNRPAPFKTGFD